MADETQDRAAEVAELRAENAELRAQLAEARVTAEYSAGTIVALRHMLAEARAASARPAGRDGRRIIHSGGNA